MRTLRRFQVSVHNALLVGVLYRLADRDKQFQSLADTQLAIVAELRQRQTVYQFHDEVGPAILRQSAIEDFGDIGMIHHSKGLAFLLKSLQHRLGIHPWLDEFECHSSFHWFRLLGNPDLTHTALSKFLF